MYVESCCKITLNVLSVLLEWEIEMFQELASKSWWEINEKELRIKISTKNLHKSPNEVWSGHSQTSAYQTFMVKRKAKKPYNCGFTNYVTKMFLSSRQLHCHQYRMSTYRSSSFTPALWHFTHEMSTQRYNNNPDINQKNHSQRANLRQATILNLNHVTIRFAICHFLLVAHWNRISISNYYQNTEPPKMLTSAQTNEPTNKHDRTQ